MPDPTRSSACSAARPNCSAPRPAPGGRRPLESADEVLVVGDLHGNLPAFRKVLEVAALANNPRRHLVLQELVHGTRIYPDDGGDKSHQLVDLVCRAEVPVPRPGPPDPGQPRAVRADRPADRQERRRAQRPVPPGDRDRLRHACRRRSTRPTTTLRRPAPGRPDPEPRLRLPHDPRPDRPRRLDLDMLEADDWPASRCARRDRLRPDLGAEHRPRDRRPLRRDGRRRLVHHRPPALRRGVPPGQPPPDHHRRHRPLPDLLPVPRPRAGHHRDAARGRPRPAGLSERRERHPRPCASGHRAARRFDRMGNDPWREK